MQGVSTSDCGLDISCLCSDDTFLTSLEGMVQTECSPEDGESEHTILSLLQQSFALQLYLETLLSPIINILQRDGWSTVLTYFCLIGAFSLASQLCITADPSLNESRTAMIIAIISICIFLSVASVVGRIISRRMSGVKLWWDDYLILLALVSLLGASIRRYRM
jgi:hypothetical protein